MLKSLLKFIILIIIFTSLIFLFSKSKNINQNPKYILNIANKEINLIIANTEELKTKGLGGIESLSENTAMLFTFDKKDFYGIWMKDMKISLDIFWLDENGKIISLEENISPNTYPKIFYPVGKGSFILETNANFAKKNNLLVGKVLDLTLK